MANNEQEQDFIEDHHFLNLLMAIKEEPRESTEIQPEFQQPLQQPLIQQQHNPQVLLNDNANIFLPPSKNRDPRLSENVDSGVYRNNFIKSKITAQQIIGNNQQLGAGSGINNGMNMQTDGVFARAKAIQASLQSENNNTFYANAPSNLLAGDVNKLTNMSPLIQRPNNALLQLQVTNENVNELQFTPNQVSLHTQKIGKRIGADFQQITAEVNRAKKRLLSSSSSCSSPLGNANLPSQPPLPPFKPPSPKKVEDKETQTDKNSVGLTFEISHEEFQNLPDEKINMLHDFMLMFNVKDQNKTGSIIQRIEFRRALWRSNAIKKSPKKQILMKQGPPL